MRRLLVLALLSLGSVLVAQLVVQPAAYACDQPTRPLPQQLQAAGSVFTGTVTEVTPGARASYAVAVSRVFKGRVLEQTTVVSPTMVAACGLQGIQPRRTYLFVSSQSGAETLLALSHEGTRRLTPQLRTRVVDQLGVGTTPVADPAEPAEEGATLTRVGDEEPQSFLPLALPGVLLLVGGLLALALARLVSRGRFRP
jgi:hypothetical protein